MAVIIRTSQYDGETDELCTKFYSCPSCGFERVPKSKGDDYTRQTYDHPEDDLSARYCPGCCTLIEWIDDPS
jgi:hypothetical protein